MLSLPAMDGARAADPKPPISGLVSRGEPSNTLQPLNTEANAGVFFGGLVVQATWANLQPDGPDTDLSKDAIDAINQVLAQVRDYNSNPQYSTAPGFRPLAVRLRVFSGCDAPDWAKKLAAPLSPFDIFSSDPATPSCSFGPFWRDDYRTAWLHFQERLAGKYDVEPLIQEVAVTSCSTATAEPFVFPVGDIDATTQRAMKNAGYTDEKHRQCLTQAVDDYAQWKTTRLTFPFSSFRGLTQAADVAFTEQVMRGCRQAVGRRCVLDNHGLDSNLEAHILPIYALIRKMGPEIAFQTLVEAPHDFEGTIRKGISLGAGSIELYQQPAGFPAVDSATLKQWAAMFQPQ